ncbi:MAG TPA: ABC transporter permease subunit [Chitinophagaceae bacterium]|jgi:ABC-2 type transport system permease protein|nr:ABC transporter permease subunit [Chitinophagaceae bacterium]
MWAICKKEFRQFFSNLTGLIALLLFLLINGLMLFVFPDSNIFDFGYATLQRFFDLAPLILVFLIPAITMRTFSEEFRAGTYEVLQTLPLSRWQLVSGKYAGSLLVIFIALVPTLFYMVSIEALSETGGIDTGATTGSYFGLLFLAGVFSAIGLFCSSFTSNAVISFLISAAACLLLYSGFEIISRIPAFSAGPDYYIEMLGIDFHYRSISRGLIDSRDLVYFISMIAVFLFFTHRNLVRR